LGKDEGKVGRLPYLCLCKQALLARSLICASVGAGTSLNLATVARPMSLVRCPCTLVKALATLDGCDSSQSSTGYLCLQDNK
jgi:hypothetical protein